MSNAAVDTCGAAIQMKYAWHANRWRGRDILRL
jgi:hypothetical protein